MHSVRACMVCAHAGRVRMHDEGAGMVCVHAGRVHTRSVWAHARCARTRGVRTRMVCAHAWCVCRQSVCTCAMRGHMHNVRACVVCAHAWCVRAQSSVVARAQCAGMVCVQARRARTGGHMHGEHACALRMECAQAGPVCMQVAVCVRAEGCVCQVGVYAVCRCSQGVCARAVWECLPSTGQAEPRCRLGVCV